MDPIDIYQCYDCDKYWTVGPGMLILRCSHCGSKQRDPKKTIHDVHAFLSDLLNGDAIEIVEFLKMGRDEDNGLASLDYWST